MVEAVRIFAPSHKRRLVIGLISCILVVFGLAIAQEVPHGPFRLAFIVIPVLAAASNILSGFTNRLVLSPTHLQYKTTWGGWKLERHELESWKLIRNKGQHNSILQVIDGQGRRFVVTDLSSLSIHDDNGFSREFSNWLRSTSK